MELPLPHPKSCYIYKYIMYMKRPHILFPQVAQPPPKKNNIFTASYLQVTGLVACKFPSSARFFCTCTWKSLHHQTETVEAFQTESSSSNTGTWQRLGSRPSKKTVAPNLAEFWWKITSEKRASSWLWPVSKRGLFLITCFRTVSPLLGQFLELAGLECLKHRLVSWFGKDRRRVTSKTSKFTH